MSKVMKKNLDGKTSKTKRSRSKTVQSVPKKVKMEDVSSVTEPSKKSKEPAVKKLKTKGSVKKSSAAKRTPTPALSAERLREIQQITIKAKRCPSLTTALINRALKNDYRNRLYLSNLNHCRTLLKEQKENALLNADETKVAKLEKKYIEDLAKLEKIEKEGTETPGVLKPEYETFLKKIHPKKPVSGYMKFAQDVRNEIQTNNPTATFGEMGKLIGNAWKMLPEDKKLIYSKKGNECTLSTTITETVSSPTQSDTITRTDSVVMST